jgi:hypothetical protein
MVAVAHTHPPSFHYANSYSFSSPFAMLVRHARDFTLQLAERYLTRLLFRQIVARVEQVAR